MDALEKKLKKLQDITPDASFATSSRAAILSTRKNTLRQETFANIFKNVGLSLSITTAAFTLLIAINYLRVNNPVNSAISSLDEIETEMTSIDQNLATAKEEVNSLKSANQKASMALTEAAGNGPSHLNTAIINQELETIENVDFDKEDEIKKLLEKASQ